MVQSRGSPLREVKLVSKEQIFNRLQDPIGFRLDVASFLGFHHFTPTIGLGCWTGGYMLFCIFACSTCWWQWGAGDGHTHTAMREGLLGRGLPLVVMNDAIWLAWIVLAQVTGTYQSCTCRSNTWGYGGRYINLLTTSHSPAPLVAVSCLSATATSARPAQDARR